MSTSPITAAKNAQGYVSGSNRKRCDTCGHKSTGYGPDMMTCGIGKFIVTKYSVCKSWVLVQPPGFKQSAPVPPIQPAGAV